MEWLPAVRFISTKGLPTGDTGNLYVPHPVRDLVSAGIGAWVNAFTTICHN